MKAERVDVDEADAREIRGGIGYQGKMGVSFSEVQRSPLNAHREIFQKTRDQLFQSLE